MRNKGFLGVPGLKGVGEFGLEGLQKFPRQTTRYPSVLSSTVWFKGSVKFKGLGDISRSDDEKSQINMSRSLRLPQAILHLYPSQGSCLTEIVCVGKNVQNCTYKKAQDYEEISPE